MLLSTIVCDTEASRKGTICRSYATLEPVFSCVRTSLYATNEWITYVSATTGSFWTSTGDTVCMILPQRNYVTRAAGTPKPGVTERLMGSLRDAFPELKELSEEDLERLLQRMRR